MNLQPYSEASSPCYAYLKRCDSLHEPDAASINYDGMIPKILTRLRNVKKAEIRGWRGRASSTILKTANSSMRCHRADD